MASPLGRRVQPPQRAVSPSSHMMLLKRVAVSAVALGLLVVLVLHLSYAHPAPAALDEMPASIAANFHSLPAPADANEYHPTPVGKEASVFDINGLLKEVEQDEKDEEMVDNMHATAAKKLAEFHAIEAALEKKTPALEDDVSKAKLANVAAQEAVDRAALEVASVKSNVDATNATLQRFLKDVHDASQSQESLSQRGKTLVAELEHLHKRAAIQDAAVKAAQLEADKSSALVAQDSAAVNAAQCSPPPLTSLLFSCIDFPPSLRYAVAATSGAVSARAADTSAQVKASKALVAAVKDNQVAGEAHSAVKGAAMLADTDDFRRSVLTSVKTTLVALKRDSKPSLAAVTGEHAKAVEVLQQAQARLQAAEVLHGKDVEALKAAEALQLSITSQISAANAQLNAITAELEGLKQSIQSCTNSASDFQAKLNDELRGYITALKKFQALKAAEDAAQAHLKLAEDALHLLQARAAKLQEDENKAEQAADAAAKKVVPTVPARAPAQVSKATVSK